MASGDDKCDLPAIEDMGGLAVGLSGDIGTAAGGDRWRCFLLERYDR